MPITKVNSIILETAPVDADQFDRAGAMAASQYCFVDDNDHLKQLKVDLSGAATSTTATVAFAGAADATFTLPAASTTLSGIDKVLQYSAPATGATVTVSAATENLLLKPAGTIATLTVTLPVTPNAGHTVSLMSSQIVTALTVDPGAASIVGAALTALTAGGFARYSYRVADTSWYRVG